MTDTALATESDSIQIVWQPDSKSASARHSRTPSRAFMWGALPFIPFAAALGAAIYRAIGSAATPDEVSFIQMLNMWQDKPHGLIPPNILGYGSGWWSSLAVITDAFNAHIPAKQDIYLSTASTSELHALAVSRLFSVALLFGAIGFAMLRTSNKTARWAIATIVVLPFVWFSGKWVAPDLPAVAMAIFAGSCIARGKWTAASLWMGIDIGLRVSNLFIVFGFFVFALYSAWRSRGVVRGALLAVGAIVLGYLIGNPWILIHPIEAFQNTKGLVPQNVTDTLRWAIAKDLFQGGYSSVEWDSASRGSLLFWSGGVVVVASLVAIQLTHRMWALFNASVLGAVGIIGIVSYRGLGYGWYVMPWVGIAFVATMSALPPVQFKAWFRNASLIAMCIGLVLAIPTSYTQASYVINRTHSLQEVNANLSCILNSTPANLPVASLIDPVVIPEALLKYRDGQPSYYAMRRFLDQNADSKTLVVITTQPVIDKIGYWVTPILNATGERVNCGPFIIGRPLPS